MSMNRNADFDVRDVLTCIESKELREYLETLPEGLSMAKMIEIVCGAPCSLHRKLRRLFNLKFSSTDADDRRLVDAHRVVLERAVEELKGIGDKRGVLLIELSGTADEEDDDNRFDGPFVAFSWDEAKEAIQAYRVECADDYDWSEMYWTIELYRQSDDLTRDGFRQPVYTFIADQNGDSQYVQLNTRGRFGVIDKWTFGCSAPNLNLPVPFRPGDILQIDGRPYEPGPSYCLLAEVGNDCCGIQCLYPVGEGKIRCAALKHGHHSQTSERADQYLSPLYRAETYQGELPEDCAFMKSLAEAIYAYPELGRVIGNGGRDYTEEELLHLARENRPDDAEKDGNDEHETS